jgi:hypothetical protein
MTDSRLDDLNQTISFYPLAKHRFMRNSGIYFALASLVFVVLAEHWWGLMLAIAGLMAGLALAIWAWRRLKHPRNPIYVLSTAGVFIHIAGARDVMVPWSEVRDVVSSDIGVTTNGVPLPVLGKYKDLTLIVVSQGFYDREIHVDSLYRRGPGWSNVFVPRNGQVGIALNHVHLGIDGAKLRQAVESRWRAAPSSPALDAAGSEGPW